MQNKPNFQKLKTNATPFATNSYTNISLRCARKNKPKQTQFQPKTRDLLDPERTGCVAIGILRLSPLIWSKKRRSSCRFWCVFAIMTQPAGVGGKYTSACRRRLNGIAVLTSRGGWFNRFLDKPAAAGKLGMTRGLRRRDYRAGRGSYSTWGNAANPSRNRNRPA